MGSLMQYGHFDDLAKEYVIDGLRIDPCTPSAWSGFSAVRRFRGGTIRIVAHNPQKVCMGVVNMAVNGMKSHG